MKCNDIKYIIHPISIKKVDDRLLRGSAVITTGKMRTLKDEGVTQIIDLRENTNILGIFLKKIEQLYCKIFNINYVEKPSILKGNSIPDENYYNDINTTIKNNNGKTYIHCFWGSHRTGFCVAMYEKESKKNHNEIINELMAESYNDKIDNQALTEILNTFLKKYFDKK